MSNLSWEVEAMDQPEPQPTPQPEMEQPLEFEPEAQPSAEPANEPGALAVSVDDFSALEERILRAVNLLKRERAARAEAEDRTGKAEARVAELAPQMELLQAEVKTLRAERDHVRQRVERLLAQLDALEL